MLREFLFVALAAMCLALTPLASSATTLLPDAGDLPKGVDEINAGVASDHIIRNYVDGGKTSFTQDVRCPVSGCNFPANTKIGTLTFDFAAYTGIRKTDPAAGPDTIGGAAIRGGFVFDPGYFLKPNWKLRWLQTYREVIPGSPDNTKVDGNPFYPNFITAGIDALLYDVPFDLLTRNISLIFESALVCVDCSNENNVKYIGSFLWGYTILNGAVTGLKPQLWGPPTQSFLDIVAAEYPNLKLAAGCCVQVPEPGPAGLLVFALICLVAVRWRPDASRSRAAA